MSDAVNHPAHYGGDTPYEPIKVIRAWGLGFSLGNAVKYIARAGKKDPAKHVEDLRKAIFYIEDEIAEVERKLEGQRILTPPADPVLRQRNDGMPNVYLCNECGEEIDIDHPSDKQEHEDRNGHRMYEAVTNAAY